ncbi:MAG: hypothetical protein K2O10_04270, partial [Muribaculaceae bacterium]|nr:hypothetical protein [Muribaculaceae bacterium]
SKIKAGAIDDLIDNLPIVDKQTEPAADATPTAAEAPARRATRRTSAKATATKKTETNEIPPIDDDNWLIPTPPRSSRQKQSEASENDDFGYKEPPRRPESDNPAQMSLF